MTHGHREEMPRLCEVLFLRILPGGITTTMASMRVYP